MSSSNKDNEMVAEVAKEFGDNIALMRKCKCVGVSLWNCLKFKLRLELGLLANPDFPFRQKV